ncbi:MAG: hypothetical protein M3N21_01600 [Actinomycetota bacterium]|nr:hypothetical protein [Actinomycetota bacterium]
MQVRTALLAATVAAAAGIALTAPPSSAAGVPVLDGKKTKVLSFSGSGGLQDNDSDFVTGTVKANDRTQCEAPRCAAMVFIYKPAKGVKGDTAYTLTWTNPGSDFDLYVAEIAKDGSRSKIAGCGAGAGNHEKVFIPAGTLKSGKKYAVVVDFYRSLNETMTAKVEMPGTDTVATTVPAAVNNLQTVNCAL